MNPDKIWEHALSTATRLGKLREYCIKEGLGEPSFSDLLELDEILLNIIRDKHERTEESIRDN